MWSYESCDVMGSATLFLMAADAVSLLEGNFPGGTSLPWHDAMAKVCRQCSARRWQHRSMSLPCTGTGQSSAPAAVRCPAHVMQSA